MSSQPAYLCVHIPEFSAQAISRLRPEYCDLPFAVLSGEVPFQTVCSLNISALRHGVRRGMARAELDSIPELRVFRRSADEERAAISALVESLGAFTPRIENHSADPVCVLVLDITGTARLLGPADVLAKCVLDTLRKLNLRGRLVISRNLQTALCVARAHSRSLTIIADGNEASALAGLPLSALKLTPAYAETLRTWGLRTLGELAVLPETDLVIRLGPEGARLRQLARGEAQHFMVPIEPVSALREVIAFDTPVEEIDSLLFVLRPMLGQLIHRAGNRALALANVRLRLELDGGGDHVRDVRPAIPTTDELLLLKLLQLDLSAHPPARGILSVHLSAESGTRSKVQLGLYSPQLPEPSRLDVTLARIAAIVGDKRVGTPRLTDAHVPESFTIERFTVHATRREHPPRNTVARVALRRLRPKVPVRVRVIHGALNAVAIHGVRYQVVKRFGPWRRSGTWWSGEVWSRDEWDVELEGANGSKMVCLLAHDLLLDQWLVEGMYD